jgi:hypothetical protein
LPVSAPHWEMGGCSAPEISQVQILPGCPFESLTP